MYQQVRHLEGFKGGDFRKEDERILKLNPGRKARNKQFWC